jgi:hypothetical protein
MEPWKRALEQLITRAVSDASHDVDSASRDERSFEAFENGHPLPLTLMLPAGVAGS